MCTLETFHVGLIGVESSGGGSQDDIECRVIVA